MERSFFSEIIASIADARFAGKDGRYIFTRDYLTVKARVCITRSEVKGVLGLGISALLYVCRACGCL
jgi:hypothetical protein